MQAEHSRALRLAAGTAGQGESELEQALESSITVVSVDPTMPTAVTTVRVLLTTLRRLPGTLVLKRDGLSGDVVDELAAAVHAIDPERPLRIDHVGETTVRLHVGTGSGDQAIRLVPEAYGAHIAGERTASIRPRRPGNPLGAVYTAALGGAEAFKYTAQVRPSRRVLHRQLRFCPVTLSPDLAAVPDIVEALELELTLVGVGAIGTGVLLLLQELGASGRMLAVDYQCYAPENRGTYSVGGEAEVVAAIEKVRLAKQTLPGFDVIPFPDRVENLPAAIDAREVPWLPVVLSGLDTPDARRETQRLWPDLLIDAATGDTMLGLHEHLYPTGPCMTCFFPIERGGPAAAERLGEITGLPVSLLMCGDEILREEHLADLTHEQQALVRPYLGKAVCGLARAIGLTDLDAGGYQPSVPFISLQAAALAVGRLIARMGSGEQEYALPNLVQYDALFGPQAITLEEMRAVDGCYCQTNASVIERVRASRHE